MTQRTTDKTKRPLYTSALMWILIGALGFANVFAQRFRASTLSEFFTQSAWSWPELMLGGVTLALLATMIVSFVRSRGRARG